MALFVSWWRPNGSSHNWIMMFGYCALM